MLSMLLARDQMLDVHVDVQAQGQLIHLVREDPVDKSTPLLVQSTHTTHGPVWLQHPTQIHLQTPSRRFTIPGRQPYLCLVHQLYPLHLVQPCHGKLDSSH